MASASASNATRLCVLACRQTSRLSAIPPHIPRISRFSPASRRTLTSTRTRWAEEPPSSEQQAETEDSSTPSGSPAAQDATSPGAAGKAPAKSALPFGESLESQSYQILDRAAKNNGYATYAQYLEGSLGSGAVGFPRDDRQFDMEIMPLLEPKPEKRSIWHDEEDEEMDTEDIEDPEEDDMTELGHAKLEEIKEMRHYNRLAIWELPLLSSGSPSIKPMPPDSE